MQSTQQVGQRLVELCKANQFLQAIDELYADDIVSVEVHAMPGSGKETAGKQAVRNKSVWWVENHTIHKMVTDGPWPHGDQFIVTFDIDVTPKAGPMAGKRMAMKEAGLYTVRDGKVVHEKFFYSAG